MARPIRIERAGGWYHLTARGNGRRVIYRDGKARHHLWEEYQRVRQLLNVDSAEKPPFRCFVHLQVVDSQGSNFCIFSKTGGFSAESNVKM
jgi:hypothetical protein